MNVFFQCVAEAVAEHGLRGLAEFVPGGGAMFDIQGRLGEVSPAP